MLKEIKYNGYTTTPSDYECTDGDLAIAINLVPEEGGTLKPIFPPGPILTLTSPEKVKYIHQTSAFLHYIILNPDTKTISWVDKVDIDPTTLLPTNKSNLKSFPGAEIYGINSVGNTLIVLTSEGVQYFLWKSDTEDYLYLGDHVPTIELSFGLVGHPRLFSMEDDSKSTFNITFDGIAESEINAPFTEANKTKITDQVMAKVNKFVANETINKGRFCFPFFVRYALRLYDGSLVCHSAPVLMNPSTTACPVVIWKRLKGKKTYTEATLDIMLVAATLDYRLHYNDDWTDLNLWSDIIKSVDVFISKPLYTFDQNGQCTSFSDSDDFESRFVGRLYHEPFNSTTTLLPLGEAPRTDTILGPADDTSFLNTYAEWRYSHIYGLYFNQQREYPSSTLHLPEFSDDKELETLRNTAQFYKLCSLEPKEIYDNRTVRTGIKVEDDYLQSLLTREVMTDDYHSHDQLRASYSFNYNSRLHLSGIRRKLFKGFSAQGMFAFVSDIVTVNFNKKDNNKIIVTPARDTDGGSLTVFIKEEGQYFRFTISNWPLYGIQIANLMSPYTFVQKTFRNGEEVQSYEGRYKYHWPCYFFYPNVNAYKIAIRNSMLETFYIDLKPHEFLNGAYAVLDYNSVREDNSATFTPPASPYVPDEEYGVIDVPNKIYTSEVNNPFYFPLLGINTVGTGTILGICSAVKALSQGQFGQFPLYAFTTEGVWALEVSSTGTYSARQPVTRDVCISPDSITQIDSAVLFATERGIMLLSGSTSQCLTETIETNTPFDFSSMSHYEDCLRLSGLTTDDCDFLPFRDYISSCRMIYDYINQHIIVFNPSTSYAYVYSLKSKQWGIAHSNIKDSVNSYPTAMATDKDGNLVSFAVNNTPGSISGLAVSRPLKLGMPDTLKTVDTMIQRGLFCTGHVRSILYGSRDLFSWHMVSSSTDHKLSGFSGTPYKYFRIAALCNLSSHESLYGCTVQFAPRFTNRPR
ncbi:MAG: hypothetical protein NC212_08535 [Staphylococcus sp.]|nr:hypothetical protein [Staphylococcus sp.]